MRRNWLYGMSVALGLIIAQSGIARADQTCPPTPMDGRIDVATAIVAATEIAGSATITMGSCGSWTMTPNNAFEGTFADLGITRDLDMVIFKKSLEELLPQIKGDIAQIPENPALHVEQVADYVQLSLLGAEPIHRRNGHE